MIQQQRAATAIDPYQSFNIRNLQNLQSNGTIKNEQDTGGPANSRSALSQAQTNVSKLKVNIQQKSSTLLQNAKYKSGGQKNQIVISDRKHQDCP